MPDSLKNFQAGTTNWRAIIKQNQRRTYGVMAVFILLYVLLGLLIDLFIYSNHYPNAPLSTIFQALVTFQITPVVTIITTLIAIVSLWVTFAFHRKLMLLGTVYREIPPQTAKTPQEKQLYNIVEELKIAAGLSTMPKVYIMDADYMNAFASGYSEKSAIVAITQGLLDKLNRDETQAVMAHEMSHIRHMDIKLTLMASVLSNLLLVIVDIFFWSAVFSGGRRSEREGGNWLFIVIILLRYLMPIITVILMLFLSRTREYMADAGCVELTRENEPLARALLKIQSDHENNQMQYAKAYNQTPHEHVRREAYIFDPIKAGIEDRSSLSDFFSTHPSIQNRLKALGFQKKDN